MIRPIVLTVCCASLALLLVGCSSSRELTMENHEDISQSRLFYIEDKDVLKGLANLEKLGKV